MPRVERTEIKYFEIETVDGVKKKVEKTDSVYVRSIPYRKRARMLADFRGDVQPDAEGNINVNRIPIDRHADFEIGSIVAGVSNAEGQLVYKQEDIDDWSMPKIKAYFLAVSAFQNQSVEEVAKNSGSTQTGETS